MRWQCRSAFSRRRLFRRSPPLVPLDEALYNTLAEPERASLLNNIEAYVEVLSPHELRVFQLIVEGCSPDEMGDVLGIKPQSAVQLRHRVIAKLRNAPSAGIYFVTLGTKQGSSTQKLVVN